MELDKTDENEESESKSEGENFDPMAFYSCLDVKHKTLRNKDPINGHKKATANDLNLVTPDEFLRS